VLVLVDLFVFEVVVAPILRVATHERKGGFTQVVFEEAVAGLNHAGILPFKGAGFMLFPNKTGILRKAGLSFGKAVSSPTSAMIPAENTGPIPLMDVNVFGMFSNCRSISLSNALIWACIARMEHSCSE
jgi:hypothetical protein